MIKQIYDLLLEKYGAQKWWPVTKKGESIPKYSGGPTNEKQQFEVVIGAILTQNTSWKNVEKALVNLNKEQLIEPLKILKTPTEKLAQLIRPSGYYNQKAERIKIITKFFIENKEPERKQLLALKGIGQETADSILLYAYNKPYFVIDTYTKRIFNRIGLKKERYEDLQSIFQTKLKNDTKLYKEYHALIVEHAKQFCKKKPECTNCPISKVCKKFI